MRGTYVETRAGLRFDSVSVALLLLVMGLLGVMGCEGSRAPAAEPSPPTPTPTPSGSGSDAAVMPDAAAAAPAAKPYAGAMTFRALLADLVDQSKGGMPTAKALIGRYSPRAKASMKAGPNLDHPKWASTITGADDVFLDLEGELAGLQFYEDSRGWGAYAVLAVAKGTLAEAEAVVGKTTFVPRRPDDVHSGRTVAAHVTRGDKIVGVFIELSKTNEELVHEVMIHFER